MSTIFRPPLESGKWTIGDQAPTAAAKDPSTRIFGQIDKGPGEKARYVAMPRAFRDVIEHDE
jgi:hypothetical protein